MEAPEESHKQRVLRSLQPIETLLIVDSIDQRAVAPRQLKELLTTCPGIKVLATANRPVGLEDEQLFEIEGSN